MNSIHPSLGTNRSTLPLSMEAALLATVGFWLKQIQG